MIRMSSIGFSQYSIAEDGRVYSHKINKWVKQQISNNGYYVVSMGYISLLIQMSIQSFLMNWITNIQMLILT